MNRLIVQTFGTFLLGVFLLGVLMAIAALSFGFLERRIHYEV